MASSDFNYKKYSLEHLENWIHDAINCDDVTPDEIYDLIVGVVDETLEYHKTYLDKSVKLLSLLKGNREIDLGHEPYDGWDYGAAGAKFPPVTEATKKDWIDFWEETYYPQEYEKSVYTEEELDAMCDAASEQEEKNKCREYNLREAEYYNQRALIDAEYNKMKDQVSRNDSTRLKYEDGWVYESPDGGKTVTKRRPGTTEKIVVQKEEKKSWTLPVEESTIDGVKDYYVTFPDDLLKAADLKEGDTIEWVDRKDGSYELRKSLSCPPCPPCDTLSCVDHLTDE
jgi:hypothetical protein